MGVETISLVDLIMLLPAYMFYVSQNQIQVLRIRRHAFMADMGKS